MVDSAVWSYLRRYEHWPATFERLPQKEGAYVIYRIDPGADQGSSGEHLGLVTLRKSVAGTSMEIGEPRVLERETSEDEWKAFRQVEQAAIERHKPEGFNADDTSQVAALRAAVDGDIKVMLARLELMAKPNDEWLARYGEFEARMESITAGLLSWLETQGIVVAPTSSDPKDASAGTVSENSDSLIPAVYRQIIKLWNEGYTAGEIAVWDGVTQSAGTIRNIITAERKRLAKQVGEERARELIKYHGK